MPDREYVIQLKLVAQDAIGPTLAKVGAEVEAFRKAVNKSGLDKARKEAQEFGQSLQKDIDANLTKVRSGLADTGRESERFANRIRELKKEITATNSELKDSDSNVKRLRERHLEAARDVDKHRAALDKLNASQVKQRGSTLDIHAAEKKRNDEIEKTSGLLRNAEERVKRYEQAQLRVRDATGDLSRQTAALTKLENDLGKALDRSEKAYDRHLRKVGELRDLRERMQHDPVASVGFDHGTLDRQLREEEERALAAGQERNALRAQAIHFKFDVDDSEATEKFAKIEAEKAVAGKDIHADFEVDVAKAIADLRLVRHEANAAHAAAQGSSGMGMVSWVKQLRNEMEKSRSSVAAFDNALRGMLILSVVGGMQPLLTVVMALGAELIAVASSAIMAGTALGGALVSGAAQALPVIGLLVAAFQRFGAVIEAVKQQQLLKQQTSYKGDESAKKEASATDGLASAHDSLRSALEGVTNAKLSLLDAEVTLTRARFESSRQLEDLILQEKRAELAAKGAALGQIQSRAALRSAIREGRLTDVAGAELGVEEADLSRTEAGIGAQRARQDRRFQERGSPLRPDTSVEDAERGVSQARRSLEAANRAVDAARRGLASAKRTADEAGDSVMASAGKFNYMLSQLTAAEKRLYQGVTRLYDTYKRVFRPITDIIVNSFTLGVNRVNQLIQDPKIISGFTQLADGVSRSMDRITKLFTSPAMVKFFSFMLGEAKRNLGPLTTAFLQITRAFTSIATAAAPVLRDIVDWIAQAATEFRKWVGGGKELRDFFREGEKHLAAWGRLAGAILKLFLALIGASAGEGLRGVQALTAEINKATGWIEHHRKEVAHFFHEVGQVMAVLGAVLYALGKEILRAFDVKSVKALGNILIKVFIPALGEAIQVFGKFLVAADKFLRNPMAAQVLKIAVAYTIWAKVARPIGGILEGLIVKVSTVAKGMGGLAARLAGANTELIASKGPMAALSIAAEEAGVSVTALLVSTFAIPLAIAAIIAIFVLLASKFGVLDDIIDALGRGFQTIKKAVVPAFNDLKKQLQDLGKALGLLGGKGEGLGKIFRLVFIGFVKGILIPVIEDAAKYIGAVLGGALEVLAGIVEIVTGILTLNFGKIIDGVGKLVKGFTRPFRTIQGIVWGHLMDILGVIVRGIGRIFGWMIDRAKDLPGLWFHAFTGLVKLWASLPLRLLSALRGAFPAVWTFLKSLPEKFFDAASGIAGRFVDGLKKLPHLLADALSGVGGIIADIGRALGDWINDHTLFGDHVHIGVPIGPDIDFDMPEFRWGGPIGKGYGGGDKVMMLGEEGEHVVTKEEVRSAGGHGAVMAWRRSLGGGGQSRGGRYAQGGAVKGSADSAESDTGFTLASLVAQIVDFGGEALAAWDSIWDGIQKRSRGGASSVANRFEAMRKDLAKTSNKIENQVGGAFRDLAKKVGHNVDEMADAVYDAMSYIAQTANKALKAFGVDPVSINFQKPDKGGGGKGGGKAEAKAGGGFIGRMGERGADLVPTWLGRGEAVLNWAHQKVVDPAMRWYYGFGLNDMFGKVQGQHAAGGAEGFAKGRPGIPTASLFDGHPSNVASSLRHLIEIMKKRFPGLGVSSTTDHSTYTSTGGVSDHTTGHAVDLAAPMDPAGIRYMNRAAAWVKTSGLYKQLKQGIHNPNLAVNDGSFVDGPSFFGVAWPQHLDHIHLAVFDALTGAFGAGLSKVPKLKISGKGPLAEIARKATGKVRDAANKYLAKKMMLMMGAHGNVGYISGGEGAVMAQLWHALHGHGLNPMQASGIIGNAYAESSLNPAAEGYGGGGLWGFTAEPNSLANLKEFAAAHKRPWTDVGLQVQFLLDHVASSTLAHMRAASSPEESARIFMEEFERPGIPRADVREEWARRAMQTISFAKGGVIGGEGGSGAGVPIWAHIGEWILNQRQQSRLAKLLGTSVDKLKGMLGFSGGPTSYQGGGEPKDDGKHEKHEFGLGRALRASYYDGTYAEEIAQAVEEMFQKTEKVIKGLAYRLNKAVVKINKHGRVIGRESQPDRLIELELKNLQKELTELFGHKRGITKLIRSVTRELKTVTREWAPKVRDAAKEVREAEKAFHEHRTDKNKKALEEDREDLKKTKQNAHDAEQKFRDTRNALRAKQKETFEEIAAKQVEILEKMEEHLSAEIDQVNAIAHKALRSIETRQRVSTAMGFSESANAEEAGKLPVYQQQKASLEQKLERARELNSRELIEQVQDELADLEGTIAETTASIFQHVIEATEKQATREQTQLDIANRLIDIRDRYGNAPAVEQARGGALQQERSMINNQIAAQQRLLAEALAQGFGPDIVDPLREKIEDLTTQLAENEAAVYSNTVAIRNAFIEQISGRQTFIGGIFGTLESIVTGLGDLTGNVNQARISELLQLAGQQLGATGSGLREQLLAFVGERLAGTPFGAAIQALSGLHGEELVTAVKSLDFNGIINALGPGSEVAQQFEGLINALLENEVAIIQNTKSVEESMKQSNIQSFTSTAWQWFRRALFTGMGGLMPNYAEGTPFYEAAGGGEMTQDGPIYAHKGEIVVPPNFSRMLRRLVGAQAAAAGLAYGGVPAAPLSIDFATRRAATMQGEMASSAVPNALASEVSRLRAELAARSQEINVNVTEAEPGGDPTYLGSRIGLAVRSPAT